VITCNSCGYRSQEGAVNCQRCGAPLPSKGANEAGSHTGTRGQPELPAWLESLRPGDRPAAPPPGAANFSAADLIEEGALPSWMQAERMGGDSAVTGPHVALRSSSMPGPDTDGGFASRGLAARSLIDEQSLPSWMREAGQSGSTESQSGIQASSLVQPDSLPEWLQSMQPPASTPRPEGPVRPAQPAQPPRPAQTFDPTPPAQGFSARDLIDEQSLPPWMSQQSGQMPAPPPVTPTNRGQGAAPEQSGMPASSLLDMDSLPPWLRQPGQEQKGSAFPPPPVQSPLPDQSWQAPPVNNAPGSNVAGSGGKLAASSFIDTNSLPDWLRSPGAAPQGSPGGQQSGMYAGPPRVENVRVPSRPRSELNPAGDSAAAANVFASMLGVASAAPNFPSQAGSMPGTQAQSNPYNAAAPQGMPGQIPATPPGMSGPLPQPYGPGGYGAGYQAGSQNSYMMPPQAGSPIYSPQMPGMPPGPGAAGLSGGQGANAKPAKRGFFEAIRDLFFR
jgi:hypothetical protein